MTATPARTTPMAAELALAARTPAGPHSPAPLQPPAPGVPASYRIVPGEHYLVPARSAPALAQALRRLPGAETAAGGQLGWVAPGGMAAANPAAPTGPGRTHGHFPLYILQLNVTDLTGQPASNAVDVEVINTDDVIREQTSVPIAGGVGRIAVPAGHYSVFAFFADFADTGTGGGRVTAMRMVTINDLTVHAAPGVTTVAVDERSATAAVSVAATPRPATQDLLSIDFYRLAAAGNYAFTSISAPPGIPMYVNPVPPAKTGRLHYVVQWGGVAPGANPTYRYDVAFAADHVPANEVFTVLPSQLATVHQHFSADPGAAQAGGAGALFNGPVDRVTARGVPTTFGVNVILMESGQNGEAMPGNLTDYLGTTDGDQWAEQVNTPSGALVNADVHTFRAGQAYSVSWAHGPLAAGLGQHDGAQACRACIAGRTLSLGLDPAGDSEPDHVTFEPILFEPTFLPAKYHFTLYRDGVRLADSTDSDGAVVPGVPDSPATFRAVLDVNLTGQPGFTQSTRTDTDLTVRYAPAAGAPLPAADSCAGGSARTPCQILPALTLSYQLATDESNTSRSPVQAMGLRVGHISYDGAGSRAAITAAAVWVSFDGGTTWQRATVTGFSGRYSVSWPNPASARGTEPAIRVTASDALGGSITQTIFNAYTIEAATTTGSTR
ncbi:MAG TPA: hypothetical protein VGS19_19440 [Streptosporangiaceae bacterium]|nr:hypothetical protein [Streptosporangiaceae bacterium]